MAGWTFNRQARNKRPADRRTAAQRGISVTPAETPTGADATLTLEAMLGMPAAPGPAASGAQQRQLTRLVELEIIPRLMLLHRAEPGRPAPVPSPAPITSGQVHALADLAVEGSPEAVLAFVQRVLADGATQEQVFLDLLAPCARWMGELWEEDVFSFSQVTIGLWRLQRVLHELAAPPVISPRGDAFDRRILLAAVPGSQHTFGVAMVAEFFGRSGWDVACEPGAGWRDLQRRVTCEWFDVVGLSISASDSLADVASAILDMRKEAANPQLFVMVGGPMVVCLPDLAQRCGADAMAPDAPSAVALAEGSLRRSVKAA